MPPEPRPVLVTGASGYVGGALALRLAADGVPVRALVRPGAATGHLRRPGIELVEGELVRAADVERAARGAARIFHIAAVYRTAGHPDAYYEAVNVGGTANVVAAARRHGVERLVHCSTVGVHGDVPEIPCREDSPFNPGDVYQRTKLAGERLVQDAIGAGLPATVFRPASVYGPGDMRHLKLFRAIRQGRFVMIGSGETLWHPAYIDDLVDGILRCGAHPAALGRTYILASRGYVTLNQLAGLIAAAVGRPLRRLRVPYPPLHVAASLCETVCRPFGIDPPLHRRRAHFFVNNRAFSIARAEAELGYRPAVEIADGVRRTAAWYVANGHLDPPEELRASA